MLVFSFRKYNFSRMALRTCFVPKVLIRKASAAIIGKPNTSALYPFSNHTYLYLVCFQDTAFIHGFDCGTECRGDYPEQLHQFHFRHPDIFIRNIRQYYRAIF